MDNKWDLRFLNLAQHISEWSYDPSTKVGAVIVDKNKCIVSVGYNGFARGVQDHPERYADRELKYRMIVHGEMNAILTAGRDLHGCVLYTWPFASCARCAAMVIQSGIKRCVAPEIPEHLRERWAEDMALSSQMFEEAGVEVKIMPLSTFGL
jgi:dCMP deaminase